MPILTTTIRVACARTRLVAVAAVCFMYAMPASTLARVNDYYALSRVTHPVGTIARSHGGYAGGCLEGGVRMDENGPGYQLMRLSRGRYWMHPELKDYLLQYAEGIQRRHPWAGIRIGDAGGAVGGPLRSGHRSHQSGLDVDIWLDPAPERIFTYKEREDLSASSHVNRDMTVRASWTQAHNEMVLAAAADHRVARIFINAALKRRICNDTDANNPLLRKLRPWYGHDDHIHVRLSCPAGSYTCKDQPAPPPGTGCSGNDIDWWFSDEARFPAKHKPKQTAKKPKPKPRKTAKTLDSLPAVCRTLLPK